jgi:uncharacterized protein YdhG (YjbR/CyaY superfamily)
MVTSKAANVEEYLDELPPDRREVVSEVRQTILDNLPEGYVESMNWGMISYEIPLERYPDTYNKKPLAYAALAAQKNHYSIYLMGCYADSEQDAVLKEGFEQAGKRLDMGKSCVRFRKLDDVPLDVIAGVIASTTPEQFIAIYENARKK